MDIAIGIILIVSAIFLVIAVLLQSGKDKSLSGAIGGTSSDTYYGKNRGSGKDALLNKLTIIVSIVFVAIVLLSFIIQDDGKMKYEYEDFLNNMTATESTTPEESGAVTTTPGTTTTPEATTTPESTTTAE